MASTAIAPKKQYKLSRKKKDKNRQLDLFICDLSDVPFKDDLGTMEHPFFALSTKPQTLEIQYEHNGNFLTIIPSTRGLATIFDKDVLIYCISQMIAALNQGETTAKRVRFNAYDCLKTIERGTGGADYKRLEEALVRLRGTTIKTDIKTANKRVREGFGLVESYKIVQKDNQDRMVAVEVVLSDWIYNGIIEKEVLSIDPDYFLLRRPLDKRLYEIARKHCGRQNSWDIGVDKLHKKTGSKSNRGEFNRLINSTIRAQVDSKKMGVEFLPEYDMERVDKTKIRFIRRKEESVQSDVPQRSRIYPEDATGEFPKLQLQTYERARKEAPGYDVYFLESEWHSFWDENGRAALRSPDEAFIGFCRQRNATRPSP
jgi:plasmid replication initiation protein